MHLSTWAATRLIERARDATLRSIVRRAAATTATTAMTATTAAAQQNDDSSTIQKVLENLPDDLIWWLALAALNCLIFVPPIIFLSYSVNSLWPVLAILEDDAPPTYERIALQDRDVDKEDEGEKPDVALLAEEGGCSSSSSAASSSSSPSSCATSCSSRDPSVTSNLRRLNRMLYSIAGWPSLLRGLRPHMFFNLSVAILTAVSTSIPYMPKILGIAVAPLAIVQLYTAWVHIAVSAPSPKPFFRRFPSFAAAFRATALPTMTMWLAVGVAQELPLVLYRALEIDEFAWDPTGNDDAATTIAVPFLDLGRPVDILKLVALCVAWLAPMAALVVPAHAVLTRVQASTLPADERTIVPFDRSFGGRRVDGDERPINMLQAWRSLSISVWLRLYILYVKVFLITLAASIFMAAAIGIQILIIWSNLEKNSDVNE